MFLERYRLTIDPPTTHARFEVDAELCTGCGRCARACPIQLLAVVDKQVKSNERYHDFKCITCQNCKVSCPKDAITLVGDYRVHRGFWKNEHLFPGSKILPEAPGDGRDLSFEQYRDRLTETERVILTRRSVRLYRKKPVETEKLKRVIEAGRFAPSAGNNQPWKFVVIRNKRVIDEINDRCKQALRRGTTLFMPHAYLDKRVPGLAQAPYKWWQKLVVPLLSHFRTGDVEPRARGGINAATSDPDYHIFFHAPVLILLLADQRGVGSVQLDTGICGQNMVLAAHAIGLGTCWVSLVRGINYYPDFLRRLGIEDPFRIITSIALGYPSGRIDGVVAREPARVNWID